MPWVETVFVSLLGCTGKRRGESFYYSEVHAVRDSKLQGRERERENTVFVRFGNLFCNLSFF